MHTKSVGLLLIAAVLWSLSGILFKFVDWPPLAAGGGRALVAAVFLLLVYRRTLKFTWSRLQVATAIAYAACTILFAVANKLTTAANAILLQYTAPVWVALFGAWLLGEKTRRADWVAILAVFIGMGIFLFDGLRLNHVAGILIACASGIFFAATAILLRKQHTGSPIESVILGNAFGFLACLPFIITAPPLDSMGLGALLFMGVIQLGLAYLLYVKAIKHVTALEAVLIPVIEPILNPIWVFLYFSEQPSPLALTGGAIVLGAVTWRALDSIRRRPA